MKTLSHNGIMLPVYEPVGLIVKVRGKEIKLSPLQEEMAVAWVKREHLDSAKDPVFIRNFLKDFQAALGKDYMNGELALEDVDFSAARNFVDSAKKRLETMTPERRKAEREMKKKDTAANKEKYGFAVVDGEKVELAAYKAEPAGIFAGRGEHPLRGRWKAAVRVEDITLNLDPSAKMPKGFEKASREWAPDSYWIAKWDNNRKYVWISDAEPMKQEKDVEKYDMALKLAKNINSVKLHILMNMSAEEPKRRKVATCCYLIQKLGIRVGDEKDEDEADTVGATTLRAEHVSFKGGQASFKFVGKDWVPFERTVLMHDEAIANLAEFSKDRSGMLFSGIDSTDVNALLKEIMDGLTAKVFRTYIASKVVSDFLQSSDEKTLLAVKFANLEAAKAMNHQRKVPKNYDETTAKKEEKLAETLRRSKAGGKVKPEAIENLAGDICLRKETREFNLNTSLRSYIDPRIFMKWAEDNKVDILKIYPKTLQRKFSWALKLKEEHQGSGKKK